MILRMVEKYADCLQIGSRNMQNYALLKEVGRSRLPVLLKRGFSATISDLLLSAEYILSEGNPNVILCERGIRTFETMTRNTLDLNAVPILKAKTRLPVMVDPTHGIGLRDFIPQMALAAVAAGADALMIEVHDDPERAWSDGDQALCRKSSQISCSGFAPSPPRSGGTFEDVADSLGAELLGAVARSKPIAERLQCAATRREAGRFLARHRVGAGVSRGSARARTEADSLDHLPERAPAGTALREPGELAARSALPPGGGIPARSKTFYRTRRSPRNGSRFSAGSRKKAATSWSRPAPASRSRLRRAARFAPPFSGCNAARRAQLEQLVNSLGEAGYERAPQVTTRGQFAVRGGILDIYSWQAQLPIRAEFFGDEIESLREFDLDTQTSVAQFARGRDFPRRGR